MPTKTNALHCHKEPVPKFKQRLRLWLGGMYHGQSVPQTDGALGDGHRWPAVLAQAPG